MARKAVIDAVEARLAANWSHCPARGATGVIGETPGDGSATLSVEYPVANTEQITFGSPGSNIFREEGAFRLILDVGRGQRPDALGWADELRLLFQAKQFGGVRTYAPTSPTLDENNAQGLRLVLSLSVPFDHDEFG